MGSVLSICGCGGATSVLPGIPREKEMELRLKDVMETFSKSYLKAYKSELVNKARDAHQSKQSTSGSAYLVLHSAAVSSAAPSVDVPLLKAEVTIDGKPGYIATSGWDLLVFKKFPSNFDVEKSKAARMNLYHYTCKESLADIAIEAAMEQKRFMLKVNHARSTRRQLKLGFASQSERSEWRSFFTSASENAERPGNPEQTLRNAFDKAMEATRAMMMAAGGGNTSDNEGEGDVGVSSFPPDLDGTEGERLNDLVFHILQSEILNEALNQIEVPSAKQMVETAVKKLTLKGIDAAWQQVMRAVEVARPQAEKAIAKGLETIFEAEKEIKEKILDGAREFIQGQMGKCEEILNNTLQSGAQSVEKGAIAQIQIIGSLLKTTLKGQEEAAELGLDALFASLEQTKRSAFWVWNEPQAEVSAILAEEFGENDEESSKGQIAKELIEMFKEIQQSTLIAVKERLKSTSGGQTNAAMSVCIPLYRQLLIESAGDIHGITSELFIRMLKRKVLDAIFPSIKDQLSGVLQPLQDLVPDIAADILDLQRFAVDVTLQLIEQTGKQLIDGLLAGMKKNLESTASRLQEELFPLASHPSAASD